MDKEKVEKFRGQITRNGGLLSLSKTSAFGSKLKGRVKLWKKRLRGFLSRYDGEVLQLVLKAGFGETAIGHTLV